MARPKGAKDKGQRKERSDKGIGPKKKGPRPKGTPRAIPKSEAQARAWENMPHKPGPGRPPGPTWKAIFERVLGMTPDEFSAAKKDEGLTLREITAIYAVQAALSPGHPERQKCLEFLVNRTDGMPRQAVELTGADGGAIKTESIDLKSLPDEDLVKLREIHQRAAAIAADKAAGNIR